MVEKNWKKIGKNWKNLEESGRIWMDPVQILDSDPKKTFDLKINLKSKIKKIEKSCAKPLESKG